MVATTRVIIYQQLNKRRLNRQHATWTPPCGFEGPQSVVGGKTTCPKWRSLRPDEITRYGFDPRSTSGPTWRSLTRHGQLENVFVVNNEGGLRLFVMVMAESRDRSGS
jgi:hypothetical protein